MSLAHQSDRPVRDPGLSLGRKSPAIAVPAYVRGAHHLAVYATL